MPPPGWSTPFSYMRSDRRIVLLLTRRAAITARRTSPARRSPARRASSRGSGPSSRRRRPDRAARLLHVAIHLSRVVGKDPQLANLLRRVNHRLLAVALLYRRQNEHAGADFRHQSFTDGHGCASNALDHAFHK